MILQRERTIVRLDSAKVVLPSHVLSVDLAEIGNKEGIFIADVAGVAINATDSLLHGLSNQAILANMHGLASMRNRNDLSRLDCGGGNSFDQASGLVEFS